MVVEGLHGQLAVQIDGALCVYGVSERAAVLQFGSALPSVSAVVATVGRNPVEDGDAVYGQFVAYLYGLVVVQRTAKVAQAHLYAVLPCVVAVGVKVFVHLHVGFFHLGACAALEVEVESLEYIPPQLELSVPEEALAEVYGQCVGALQIVQITFLQLVVIACEVGVERDALWGKGQILVFHNLQPLALSLEVLEGLPCFPVGAPGVVHAALPGALVLIYRGFAFSALFGVAVVEGEVGGVVGHGVLLAGNVHADAAEREVAAALGVCGKRAQRVAFLLCGQCVNGVLKHHVRVERVVFRLDGGLAVAVIQGHAHLGLFGKDASQFHLCGYGVVYGVLVAAVGHALLNATETGGLHLCRHIHATDVTELDVHVALGRPSAFVGEFLQTQFVGPYFHALDRASVVAHTHHDGLDLAQCGVTHDGDLVAGTTFVIF